MKPKARFPRYPRSRRFVKDGINANDSEYAKLKRKLRIMVTDRKRYSQEVQNTIRKQGQEITALGNENDSLHHNLMVTYGPQHISTDINSTKTLRELLEARDDYERLCNIERTSCNELDSKIQALNSQLATDRNELFGDEKELHKRIGRQSCIRRLESQVDKLTTNFCTVLHENRELKEKLQLSAKEKKIYQALYDASANKISSYKHKIMEVTKEASSHYEQRLEAMAKMKTLKERSNKDETMYQAEMKILQRMIAHDSKLKEFMSIKEHERLGHKAEEAEKRAKMSVKEKALNDEAQHVQKYEELFQNVRAVTGHDYLDKVVNEFTAKDEENFAKFDYVSELSYTVEKLREDIQRIKESMRWVKLDDEKIQTSSDNTINEYQNEKAKLSTDLTVAQRKFRELHDLLQVICANVHSLFRRISCSTAAFETYLGFEDTVAPDNLKMYISLIEQRTMELICILKFIGLHQDHHENLLRAPRSIHRIRPRGPSKILLETVDKPVMPSINAPVVSEDLVESILDIEETPALPMDLSELRIKTMQKIARKEAAGLLNQPLFTPNKGGRPKSKRNKI